MTEEKARKIQWYYRMFRIVAITAIILYLTYVTHS